MQGRSQTSKRRRGKFRAQKARATRGFGGMPPRAFRLRNYLLSIFRGIFPQKSQSRSKSRRGNCLVSPHTNYGPDVFLFHQMWFVIYIFVFKKTDVTVNVWMHIHLAKTFRDLIFKWYQFFLEELQFIIISLSLCCWHPVFKYLHYILLHTYIPIYHEE